MYNQSKFNCEVFTESQMRNLWGAKLGYQFSEFHLSHFSKKLNLLMKNNSIILSLPKNHRKWFIPTCTNISDISPFWKSSNILNNFVAFRRKRVPNKATFLYLLNLKEKKLKSHKLDRRLYSFGWPPSRKCYETDT